MPSEAYDTNNTRSLPNKIFRVRLSSYKEYKKFVHKEIKKRIQHESVKEWLRNNIKETLQVFLLVFGPIHEKLRKLYSPKKVGKPPYDPQILFRSLLLMHSFGETSIDNWVKRMRGEPLLAIFCGTRPGEVPSVGVHYEFIKRLENGVFVPKCSHRVLPSEQRQARDGLRPRRRKPEKDERNNNESKKGVIERLAQKTMEQEKEARPRDLETFLNEILLEVAVKPSSQEKWLKNVGAMRLAGDGSTTESFSDPNGKATCECRKQGIYDCDHPRQISDPDAQWGWNNRKKDFVYGYRFFQLVAADNHRDLPVYLNIGSANTHEATMAIRAIDRFDKQNRELFPELRIEDMAFDALFDIHAFYRYLVHKDIRYSIPYAKTPAACVELGNGQLFSNQGAPLCAAGLPMRRHGKNRQGRITYNCPVKRPTHCNGKTVYLAHQEECPLQTLCEPDSRLGPYLHVSSTLDPRIHPQIQRDSEKFKQLANMRSCCERSNSMKKNAFCFSRTRTRVISYAFIRLTLISVLEHSRVWAEKKLENFDLQNDDILSLFL